MSGRRMVLLGLLCGMATAVLAGAIVVAFAPEVVSAPTAVPTAMPTAAPAGSVTSPGTSAPPGSPSPAVSAPAPGGLPTAPALPAPSGSPGGSVVPSGSPLPTPSLSSLFRVGQPAPLLEVRQLGGGVIDLAELRGYPVWIEFMQTWCPSCQEEFPLMNGFAARYAGDGLKVVAVDVKESEGDVAAFADRMSANFPVGLDADGSAARRWGVVGVPVHFFVDASGVIRDAALGGVGADVLAASVGKIMPGVTVTP